MKRSAAWTTTRATIVAALAYAAVGCGTSDILPSPTITSDSPLSSDGASAIALPDAYTAVLLRAVSEPTFPFLGSDGKYHIAYDLLLTNASEVPAQIDAIDVLDAAAQQRVIVSYTDKELVDPNCPFGNCNRLRRLPSSAASDRAIPAQESRALLVDFAFDTLAAVPKVVVHRVRGRAATNPGAHEPSAIDYLVTPFELAAAAPRVIAAPLKGRHWVALNGCCLPGFPHRTSLAPLNGKLVNGQRFAIDWKRLNDDGRFFVGDPTQNESYVDYGESIYAVADGTITATLDELEANTPGILPADDPVLAPQITVSNVDGNHIVQDIGGGLSAFYAHLQKDSLRVKPGDHVTKGQVIAKLGNTGNSNAAHLHFQLMSGSSVLGSDGVPYVLEQFDYDGRIPLDLIAGLDDYLSGEFFTGLLAAPEPRSEQLPVAWAIVDFPE